VLKKVLLVGKLPRNDDDFVIPAEAGIQDLFRNYLIIKIKHWTPTFVGGRPHRDFECKVGISVVFQHPANAR